MPYLPSISPSNMQDARLKALGMHAVSLHLMLQSMLGFNKPVIAGSLFFTLLNNLPPLRVLPPVFLRMNHLPTELYHQYGYEFIVTARDFVLPQRSYDKPRIYFTIEPTELVYVVVSRPSFKSMLHETYTLDRNGNRMTRGFIPIANIHASLVNVDSLETLVPHLPKIMLALQREQVVSYLHPQSAALARQTFIASCLFLMLLSSVYQINKDPVANTVGLLSKLFLWCSMDLDIPKKLFELILQQSSQQTERHIAINQAFMLSFLHVLPKEIVVSMVLFRILVNSRERVQNGLITAGVIENPNVRIEEVGLRDLAVLAVGQDHAPDYSFYLTVGMAALMGVGTVGGIVFLLAISGLMTLSSTGLAVAAATTSIGIAGGVGFFCAKNYPATFGAAVEGVAELFNGGRLEHFRPW